MISKIKKMLNVKVWFEGVIFTKVLAKATKFATGAALGLLASAKIAPHLEKLKPFLEEAGINPEQVVVVAVAAALGGLANWMKRVMEKEGVQQVS